MPDERQPSYDPSKGAPMTGHNLANYAISSMALCVALGVGIGLGTALRTDQTRLEAVSSTVSHIAPGKASRFAWPALGQDKTIALSEGLKRVSTSKYITIYCASTSCEMLRNDLDDAMQLAGWSVIYEDRSVDSETDVGLFVGPPSDQAEALRILLESTTGIETKMVDMEKFGIIIGKHQ